MRINMSDEHKFWSAVLVLIVGLFFGWALTSHAEILPPNDHPFSDCRIIYVLDLYAVQEFSFDQNYTLDNFTVYLNTLNDSLEMADLGILFKEKNGDDIQTWYVNQSAVTTTQEPYSFDINYTIDSTKIYQFWFGQLEDFVTENYWQLGIGEESVPIDSASGCYRGLSRGEDKNVAMRLNGHIDSGIKFNHSWLMPLMPTAFASTTCTFNTTSSTSTTAICSDGQISVVDDPTRNLYNGFILFFIMFFGILFYLKKRKGVR